MTKFTISAAVAVFLIGGMLAAQETPEEKALSRAVAAAASQSVSRSRISPDDVRLSSEAITRRAKAADALAARRDGARAAIPGVTIRRAKVQRILAVGPFFTNPGLPGPSPNWAAGVCNNRRWMQGADYEWTPIVNPRDGGVEDREVGASGVVINEHVSGQEVWYTHPFGSDWNMNVAIDPGYEFLLAPGTPTSDQEINNAVLEAPTALGITIPNALHVEFDSGLIGDYYRAHAGDDVVVFGRWITDCGHTNFTTEIHPPLLLAKGTSNSDPDGITHATVTSRPFLVRQTFGGKPLRDHFVSELAKVYTTPTDPLITGPIYAAVYQMTARPDIATTSFEGIQLMSFVMHPQFARVSTNDKLLIRYNINVRPGVAAQVVDNRDDSITVWVVMNDSAYQPAALPSSKNVHHTISEVKAQQPDIGGIIDGIRAGGAFSLNPYGDAVLEKGFDTDFFPMPTVVEAPLGPFIPVGDIAQGAGIQTSTVAPSPISGTIELKWERH